MSGTKQNQAAAPKAGATSASEEAEPSGAPGAKEQETDTVVSASVETETGIVAPGRTVMVGRTRHTPGTTVELPADEIEQLRALGYLLDPENPLPAASQGPEYHRSRSDVVRAR